MTRATFRQDAIEREIDDETDDGIDDERQRDLTDIWRGLAAEPRRLPCKLFYDAHGARLFEQITRLPEYYLTRSELEILERRAGEMARRIGPGAVLVEFGSGASRKTRLLLAALESPLVYVPIDISTDMLLSSAHALRKGYPGLAVRPVVGDYMQELELPLSSEELQRRVVAFFPGSTIGNFEQEEAVAFFRRLRRTCGSDAELLIGVDLPKERALLEAAYDDAEGVTARFNLNVLRVLNRDYRAQFHLNDFEHRAVWNEAASRIEMHLVSRRDQSVDVAGREFFFPAGEPIVTEYCYKYSLDAFQQLVESAGFAVQNVWLDDSERFSVQHVAPS
jgi:dimethylhistidine N-methyltransferase